MKKSNRFFLSHILDAVKQIRIYTSNVTETQFHQDRLIQDGVLRQLEVIGEACRNLPVEFHEKHPEIPWQEIIGLRNRLAHAYFSISIEIVWEVVVNELDSLEKNVTTLLAQTGQP
ncbi:DUF86 domain-containing protein [Desulfococcus sp.]|uniref:HepT-like ribonuclease domain-containing protein n=1 Tax=Desulfococcus sp. TaxID=2025834 RepID=UPI00359379D4